MKRTLFAGLVVVGLAVAISPVWAHHSNAAQYDATKRATLRGEITKVDWMNPHSYFYLAVKDASGKVTNWSMEGFPPNTLLRTGWKTSYMKVGETISVEGALARDGSNLMLAREVTLPDGQKLYWGPQQ
jgi:hypothetical protein